MQCTQDAARLESTAHAAAAPFICCRAHLFTNAMQSMRISCQLQHSSAPQQTVPGSTFCQSCLPILCSSRAHRSMLAMHHKCMQKDKITHTCRQSCLRPPWHCITHGSMLTNTHNMHCKHPQTCQHLNAHQRYTVRMYHELAPHTNRPNDCVLAASSLSAPAGCASHIRRQHVQPAAAIAGAAVLH